MPKYLYVHFDGEWCEADGALAYRGEFDKDRLSELAERIDKASHGGGSFVENQYLFLKLLLSLRPIAPRSEVAGRIEKYVDGNLSKISSLDELVYELHYSKNYVIRLFKKEFGKTPFQYINDKRLSRAKYLLETTSRTLLEIAGECGFSDYPYFYKCFVKSTGLSPTAWRRKIQTEP